MFIVTIRDRTEGDLNPPDRTFKDDARDDDGDETVFDVMIIWVPTIDPIVVCDDDQYILMMTIFPYILMMIMQAIYFDDDDVSQPIVKNHMVMVSTNLSAWIPVSHLNVTS